MKNNRRYKRFDLFSWLAVFGTLAVLLFEGVFLFELYNREIEPLDQLFRPAEEPALPQTEDPVPVG